MDYSGSYDDGVTLYDLGKHFDTYDLQVGEIPISQKNGQPKRADQPGVNSM